MVGFFQLNVLVNRSGHGCLADFGLANLVDEGILHWTSIQTTGHQGSGTLRWQAPELIDPPSDESAKATPASDIYSFACVCYEVSGVSISKTVLWKALIINL
jgi:serine/threonine protein kinase